MKTKYLSARIYSLAVIMLTMFFVPCARAATDTPLDCPGVIAIDGGYRLTRNTACRLIWRESDKIFNLNGFTLNGGSSFIDGANLTIRNGVLQINSMDLFSRNGTLSELVIISGDAPRNFFIESGSTIIVKNCVFKGIPTTVLSFFFGDGTVKNSLFIANRTAISIQRSGNVLIERNTFLGNTRGVNLFDERGGGVINNTVRNNVFLTNMLGINMDSGNEGAFLGTGMKDNKIVSNRIFGSGLSGINIKIKCSNFSTSGIPVCPGQNNVVSGNLLHHNGFQSTSGMIDDFDDGLTARATILEPILLESPFPQGLAGITLSNNRSQHNADLGFDVYGVTDGGGQQARLNGDSRQCVGVRCDSMKAGFKIRAAVPAIKKKRFAATDIASALAQYRHDTK